MEFTEQKQVVINQLKKRGSKGEIARRAGVTTQSVRNAFGKCCLSDMTEGEVRIWNVALELVSEKQKQFEAIERKTTKIAERI